MYGCLALVRFFSLNLVRHAHMPIVISNASNTVLVKTYFFCCMFYKKQYRGTNAA
jgi:hypothetical protein